MNSESVKVEAPQSASSRVAKKLRDEIQKSGIQNQLCGILFAEEDRLLKAVRKASRERDIAQVNRIANELQFIELFRVETCK